MNISSMDMNVGRSNLCDQIADRIEEMILGDITQVQQKLPSEQTLAAGFGVSRPVIREALMILKTRGLVTPKQGGGSYITMPDSTQVMDSVNRLALMNNIGIEDVMAVRIQLEVMAARLAAEHATNQQLDKLETINQMMAQNKADGDQRVKLDLKFHLQIASISGNKMLKIFVQSLNTLIEPMLRSSLVLPLANEDGIQYHDRIVQALRTRDADESERIMRKHLMLFMRNYEVSAQQQLVEDESEE